MKPTYTFDNYMVSDFNCKAYEAAKLVIEDDSCNQLYVSGAVGCGKTHLISAMAAEFEKQGKSVVFTTGELFCDDVLETLRGHISRKELAEKYKSAEVFVIDDIDFLANKEATLNEFLSVTEWYLTNGKKLIVSGKSPLNKINFNTDVDMKLKSRLAAGLTVSIGKPKVADKLKYLEILNKELNQQLNPEQLAKLSREKTSDFRELAGKIKTLSILEGLSFDG